MNRYIKLADKQVVEIVVTELSFMVCCYEDYLNDIEEGNPPQCFVSGTDKASVKADKKAIEKQIKAYNKVIKDFTV